MITVRLDIFFKLKIAVVKQKWDHKTLNIFRKTLYSELSTENTTGE